MGPVVLVVSMLVSEAALVSVVAGVASEEVEVLAAVVTALETVATSDEVDLEQAAVTALTVSAVTEDL